MLSLTKIGLEMGEKFTRITGSYFMKNIMLSLTDNNKNNKHKFILQEYPVSTKQSLTKASLLKWPKFKINTAHPSLQV